jgi:hypothetical protein
MMVNMSMSVPISTTVGYNEALAFDFISPTPSTSGSLVFSGSNWLSFTPGVTIGSGAFTVECWAYFTSASLPGVVLSTLTPGNGGFTLLINSATEIRIDRNGVASDAYAFPTIANDTWHHIAATRDSSGNQTIFVDGARSTTGATTNNGNFSGNSAGIGKFNEGGQWWLTGSVTSIRAVVGSNVYDPTATTITVPTSPLANIANTKLLLTVSSNDQYIVDSSGQQTVTNNGAVTYNASSPTFSNALTWTDSINSQTATITGNVIYDGNYGGGLRYTNDNNSYITIPYKSSDTTFTISIAANLVANTTHVVPVFNGGIIGGSARANINTGGSFIAGVAANLIIQGNTFSSSQGANTVAWYDFVYSGTSVSVYQNGTPFFAGTMNISNTGWDGPLLIGRDTASNSASGSTIYRIKYQTSALDATQISAQYANLRTSYGGATLAGSLSFPGGVAGTRMLDLTTGFTLGAGSYTIECWFRLPDFTNQYALCGANASAGDGNGMMNLIFSSATNIFTDKNGGGGSVSYTVPTMAANTWYHFVLVRSGTTEALFLNGKRAGTSQTNVIDYTAATKRIGMSYVRSWPGLITNFRVVVGTAVYSPTSTFITIPIGPLTSITNTKYLMLGANVTLDSSGVDTVTNTGSVTTSATKPF